MADSPPLIGLGAADELLGDVVPTGWLALLEGSAGSGTTLFAKQFAQAVLPNTPVLFYTSYETTPEVLRAFADHGWTTEGLTVVNLGDEYYERVLRRDLEISRTRDHGLRLDDLRESSPTPVRRRPYNLENRLLADLASIDRPFRLVLDSVDFLLEVLTASEVMVVARQIRHLCQQYHGQSMLVLQSNVHERRVQGTLEEMADLLFDLGAEQTTQGTEHVLSIRKVVNHPDRTIQLPVRATPKGLEASPRSGKGRAP